MSFHPDQNLPGCMMPDGGECCPGHVALRDDWQKQRKRIRELEDALRPFVDGVPGYEHAKLIDKRYRGLNPIQITATKFQVQAARNVLKAPAVSSTKCGSPE